MLLKLLNWVPVLFGLKFAGVASVATVSEVVAGETPAPITTSEALDKKKSATKERHAQRTSSGTLVTRLMTTADTTPVVAAQTAFAEAVTLPEASDAPAQSDRNRFVARPIAVAPPRPSARLAADKAKHEESVSRHSGQVRQDNRPKARAELKVAGKKVSKRVAWIAKRSTVAPAGSNVIPFPAPVREETQALRRAA